MARKTIAEATKKAAVGRVIAKRSTPAEEGRRYGVSAQAVRAWVREMREEVEREAKEAESRAGASTAQGGSTPPAPPGTPPPAAPAGGDPPRKVEAPPAAEGRSEADRLAAARAAAGLPSAAPAAPGGGGPVPSTGAPQSPAAPDIGDDAVVELAGNFIMGFATRGCLFISARKAKIKVKLTPELEALCVLTEKEKAALRPAVPFLAPKIRAFIGSNENIAVGAALTVVGMGLLDRTAAVGAAVRDAVQREGKAA